MMYIRRLHNVENICININDEIELGLIAETNKEYFLYKQSINEYFCFVFVILPFRNLSWQATKFAAVLIFRVAQKD